MNKEEVLAMETGAMLDSFVAENVMGWEQGGVDHRGERQYLKDGLIQNCTIDGTYAWEPSTDISAAWEIIEKLQERELFISVEARRENYRANFNKDEPFIYARTAPEAICKAALLAVMDS